MQIEANWHPSFNLLVRFTSTHDVFEWLHALPNYLVKFLLRCEEQISHDSLDTLFARFCLCVGVTHGV